MNSNSKIILALLAGAAAGVAIGLLIAPEKGSVNMENFKDSARKLADELLKKAEEFIDDINTTTQE